MIICFTTIGNIKDIATAKRALGFANVLDELGWQVHIILEDAPENRIRVGLECNSNIQTHYFKKSRLLKEIFQKNRIINEISPSHLYFCAFTFRNCVGFRSKAKKILEHSELLSSIYPNYSFKRILHLLLEYTSILYADALVCASRYLDNLYSKRKLKINKPNLPILYSPYAFNAKLFNGSKSILDSNKANKLTLLFIGSLVENYGLFVMLNAINEAVIINKNLNLILIGDGLDKQKAINYINDNSLENNIEITGFIEESALHSYFEMADIFLAPLNNTIQDWARCPSKIYMYLPFNKPVFTCKIGEAIEIFGNSGFYYDNSDPKSLASLILSYKMNENYILPNSEIHTWAYRATEFSNWLIYDLTL